MPLNVRSVAISAAVIASFGISIAGSVYGLPPFTCCKRAIAGAVVAYIAAAFAVKAINAILINAMIKNHINRRKDRNIGGTG